MFRSLEEKVASDVKTVATLQRLHSTLLLIDETLPYGADTAPTLPMDPNGGITVSVAAQIQRGEEARTVEPMEISPDPVEEEKANVHDKI